MRPAITLLALLCILVPCPAFADTPAQAQKAIQAVCDRTATAVMHKDLAGAMADRASSYVFTDISGRHYNFLQTQAVAAADYTRSHFFGMLTHKISQVTLHGNTAQAMLTLRDIIKHPRTAKSLPYTFSREYLEQTIWVKGLKGWQQTSAQMVRDVTTYSR